MSGVDAPPGPVELELLEAEELRLLAAAIGDHLPIELAERVDELRRRITIVRLLGECGLRTEELTRLERRDLRPVRRGAKRRELHVRHGKGARILLREEPAPCTPWGKLCRASGPPRTCGTTKYKWI